MRLLAGVGKIGTGRGHIAATLEDMAFSASAKHTQARKGDRLALG